MDQETKAYLESFRKDMNDLDETDFIFSETTSVNDGGVDGI